MKKLLTVAAAAICIVTAALAATYTVVEVKSTGRQALAGVGVGLATYCEVYGALPATATVAVSRISGVVTSTVATVVCTGGVGAGAASSNVYMIAGDYVLATGATNAPTVRLILTQ
jgi:hypothetical protein